MLGVALVETGFAGEMGITVPEQRTQSFTIKLNGSVADVTPLFGPVREAEWVPDWSPRFIHPAMGVQREGVVFTTTSGHGGDRLWLLNDLRRCGWPSGVRSYDTRVHGQRDQDLHCP
jgi:hypothetical protein